MAWGRIITRQQDQLPLLPPPLLLPPMPFKHIATTIAKHGHTDIVEASPSNSFVELFVVEYGEFTSAVSQVEQFFFNRFVVSRKFEKWRGFG
jgi:hypothetical protein